eukprot:5475400-Pyramimonas_sp.AAC.1
MEPCFICFARLRRGGGRLRSASKPRVIGVIGGPASQMMHVAIRRAPMGWLGAVDVAQHAARQL